MATRRVTIEAWLSLNADLVDQAGGADQDQGHAAFDAVNERYGRRGCGRVRTLRAALRACTTRGARRGEWLVDVGTLNETIPGQAVGGFRQLVADVSAVGEIRDEIARLRDDLAVLRAERASAADWAALLNRLDRDMPRHATRREVV